MRCHSGLRSEEAGRAEATGVRRAAAPDFSCFFCRRSSLSRRRRISRFISSSATRHDWPENVVKHSPARSEEHTSELQSRENLVCRLLLVKKKSLESLVPITHLTM